MAVSSSSICVLAILLTTIVAVTLAATYETNPRMRRSPVGRLPTGDDDDNDDCDGGEVNDESGGCVPIQWPPGTVRFGQYGCSEIFPPKLIAEWHDRSY